MSSPAHAPVSSAHALRAYPTVASSVLLVSMPFGPLLQPSIGLGLLKASLQSLDMSCSVRYYTLKFAQMIGSTLYEELADGKPITVDLVGEWLFSGALFEQSPAQVEAYIHQILRQQHGHGAYVRTNPTTEHFIGQVLAARERVGAFLDACLEDVLACGPRVVGFTSVFQQHTASLALAKRLKQMAPDVTVVFGGANCEGVMGTELLRSFSFVDVVVSGEGDLVFPRLIGLLLNGQGHAISELEGVYTQQTARDVSGAPVANAPSVRDMAALPFPSYEDFFEQLTRSDIQSPTPVRLLFETSRGCWWGQKQHCTFCGLNGSTMNFRSKPADRALDELLFLARTYPGHHISVVDNILDMGYFRSFLPQLSAQHLDLELFYEVKANLRKDQVALLRDSGVTRIQPGIESLSTAVLSLMRKGVSQLQNIQLLKWCKELGVKPYWNILWGFPGEPPQAYADMADLTARLSHLEPPSSAGSIRLDRFSPNYDHWQALGFSDVRPYPSYAHIYALPEENLANLAYYFTYGYAQPQDVRGYTRPLASAVQEWQAAHARSDLFFADKGEVLLVWDLRPVATQPLHVLRGAQRTLYLLCDDVGSVQQVEVQLQAAGQPTGAAEVTRMLEDLVGVGLMAADGPHYLSLGLNLEWYTPAGPILTQLQEAVQRIGQPVGGDVRIDLQAFERR